MKIVQAKTAPAKKGKATELSQKVADVLMELRQSRQMSQRAFADHIGVSFQQYQKYEKGRDRLSLEKAMLLCSQLDLPLDIFMDEGLEPQQQAGFGETAQENFGHALSKSKAVNQSVSLSVDEKEVLAIFAKIPKKSRHDFLETLRQLAKMTSVKS